MAASRHYLVSEFVERKRGPVRKYLRELAKWPMRWTHPFDGRGRFGWMYGVALTIWKWL